MTPAASILLKAEDLGETTVLGIQAVALISTLLQYLSPYPVVLRILKLRSTGDYSYVPYLFTFWNAWLTTFYGIIVKNAFMLFVNSFGVVTSAAFMIIFVRHYPRKLHLRMIIFFGSVIISALCYQAAALDPATGRYFLGSIQLAASVACYISPLATIGVVFRKRSAESLPFLLLLMNLCSSFAWFLYGVLLSDEFLQVPNFIGFLLSIVQLSIYAIFPPPRF
eukprot:CAMPEP_0181300310 /NCGR_PEP_ID=MMETSP1101-20121128/6820_1 /TAXON_ID=46948 /ORGANISM="Rhodomonas abbreviata, Strain Caron Lab Isolate" /LENGTH=222 /DNA_ID=CAMNT_0023405535 /DNA_START=322 /DNA_END=987 /DNA_ORIENTATION=+